MLQVIEDGDIYKCIVCHKKYIARSVNISCLVFHESGSCCHHEDEEVVTKPVKCDICGSTARDHTESQCQINRL